MTDRRGFLKSIGVAVPSSIAAASVIPAYAEPIRSPLTPQEVFEIYVADSLRNLPKHVPGIMTDVGSVVRALVEVQGAALATVLIELQRRR